MTTEEIIVTLLKKWLVEYKFQDWTQKENSGRTVTLTMKQDRAEEIANDLGNNKRWHSHNRCIGVNTLQNDVKLKIEEFYKNAIESGIAKRPEYSLPQIDTIGTIFQTSSKD
jgi:hypothetical protein